MNLAFTKPLDVAVRASMLAFLAAMPWPAVLWSSHGGHDVARWLSWWVMLAAAVAVALGRGESVCAPRWSAAWSVLAVLAALRVWSSASVPWAALDALLWYGMACMTMVVAALVRQGGPMRDALAWAVLAGMGLQHLIDVSLIVVGQFDGIAPKPTLLGMGYDNFRFLNHVQTVAWPLLAATPRLVPASTLMRRLSLVTMSLMAAVVWATGARATTLAWTMALLVLLCGGSVGRALAKRCLLALLWAVPVYLLIWVGLPDWLGLAEGSGLAARVHEQAGHSAREALLMDAWAQWLAHPWWGLGPMHLAAQPQLHANHPHNAYLQLLVEWGAPLALLAMGLSATALWQRWRAWRSTPAQGALLDPLAAGAGAAVVAALVDAAFSGSLVMPMSQVWVALALGCWFGATPQAADPLPHRSWSRVVAVGGLLAFLALTPMVWQAWHHLDALLQAALSDQIGTRLQPRFWSHGRIVP